MIYKSINIPNDLLQRIQGDYVAKKYQEGVFTFQNIDNETIGIVLSSILSWAEENDLVEDGSLDITFVERKK